MKRTLALFALALPLAASAQEWAWEAGQQSYNGAIAVQSVSGGLAQALPQNPLAALAKTDQSAVTQPPTIIVQSTGGGDCYLVFFDHDNNPTTPTKFLMGNGIVEGSTFTGMLYGTKTAGYYRECGAIASCAWENVSNYYGTGYSVVSVVALPITRKEAVACL